MPTKTFKSLQEFENSGFRVFNKAVHLIVEDALQNFPFVPKDDEGRDQNNDRLRHRERGSRAVANFDEGSPGYDCGVKGTFQCGLDEA